MSEWKQRAERLIYQPDSRGKREAEGRGGQPLQEPTERSVFHPVYPLNPAKMGYVPISNVLYKSVIVTRHVRVGLTLLCLCVWFLLEPAKLKAELTSLLLSILFWQPLSLWWPRGATLLQSLRHFYILENISHQKMTLLHIGKQLLQAVRQIF